MLRSVVVMDPPSPGRTASSTRDLIRTGRMLGHRVWVAYPTDLALHSGGAVQALASPVADTAFREEVNRNEQEVLNLADCDVVLLRRQPPLDLSYCATCHILQHLEEQVLILNRPSGILRYPEKLLPMRFPDLHPTTIVTGSEAFLACFRAQQSEIVIKPLYEYQGRGIFHLMRTDENYTSAIELLAHRSSLPIVMQQYLPQVREGDKRLFILDGRPIGALNRVPRPDEARANLHAGGTAAPVSLSARDLEISDTLAPLLRAAGLFFVGVDVIGGYVTEINTTSPTGFVPMRELGSIDVSLAIWRWIEEVKR